MKSAVCHAMRSSLARRAFFVGNGTSEAPPYSDADARPHREDSRPQREKKIHSCPSVPTSIGFCLKMDTMNDEGLLSVANMGFLPSCLFFPQNYPFSSSQTTKFNIINYTQFSRVCSRLCIPQGGSVHCYCKC